jgi:hypothetical protein
MRRITWLIPLAFLALLAPASSRALEVLVLTTVTPIATVSWPSGEPFDVKNQGNVSIWVQTASAAGLSVGSGREIAPGESVQIRSYGTLYGIASVAQTAGKATMVTAGLVGSTGAASALVMPDATALTTLASSLPGAPREDTQGRLFVRTTMPDATWVTTLVTATTLTQLVAAPAAGLSIYVTDLGCSSSAATTATADQQCEFKYGTGTNCGTGTALAWATFLPALGSQVANFTTPRKLPAGAALCFMNAVTGSKTFDVTYYVAP